MLKFILILFSLVFLVGCGDQFPPPEGAIKACIEKGWVVNYRSSTVNTIFECIPSEK